MSAFKIPVWWLIYIINSVDETKFLRKLQRLGNKKIYSSETETM